MGDSQHTVILDRFLALFVGLITGLVNLRSPGAEPGSSAPTGTVRLGTGITAHYAYYYNRNALADVVLAGDAVIALTDSGNLLRFERASLRLTREWFGPVPVTCLGRAEGEAVLAGFADGRVCRIDQATLRMTELARLAGKLQWVGTTAAAPGAQPNSRLVAVFEQSKKVEIRGRKYDVPYSVVGDIASDRTYAVEPRSDYPSDLRATAFLLDRKHRLWLGADNGEWDGWCSCVDLDAGEVRSIAGLRIYDDTPRLLWRNVYGFAELHDGQVWAYGGTLDLGSEAFIWRIDRERTEELYRLADEPPDGKDHRKNDPAAADRAAERVRRDFAIPHMGDDPARNLGDEPKPTPRARGYPRIVRFRRSRTSLRILIPAGSRSFPSATFTGQTHALRSGERSTSSDSLPSGRTAATGTYPSVRAVLPIEVPGAPLEMLFATQFDGLIRLIGGKETGHALPGQMGAQSIGRIENSSEGVLVFESNSGSVPLQLVDGAWRTVSFAPADPTAAVLAPLGAEPDKWNESQVLVGRDGSIATISASSWTRGSRHGLLAKRQGSGGGTRDFQPGSGLVLPHAGRNALERASRHPDAIFRWAVGQGGRFRLATQCRQRVRQSHWLRRAHRQRRRPIVGSFTTATTSY